jgi:putative ABC transport system ATP-binding protein
MIKAEQITLSYSETTVFSNLSFFIEKGERVCFTGTSGTGKSSLLKMIQGYVPPVSGSLEVDGLRMSPANNKSIRARMAYVPQNVNLPVDNARALLTLVHAEEKEAQMRNYMEQLGLPASLFTQRFDEMSGGQKQRIVIALCLSLDRDILILDEPTSSLDNESIDKLGNLVAGLTGKTILSASHNPRWISFSTKTISL